MTTSWRGYDLGGDRRQRHDAARGIEADAAAELDAAAARLAVEVAVELRRSGDVDVGERVAVRLVRLAAHRRIPDDQAIDLADRKQLVGQVVPAEIDRHRRHALPHRRAQHRNLREDETRRRDRDERRPVSREHRVHLRIRDEPIGDVVPAAAVGT